MLKNTVLYEEKQLKIGIFSRPVGMKGENVGFCSLLWWWMFFYFQFWPLSWKIHISVSALSSRMNRRRSTEKATSVNQEQTTTIDCSIRTDFLKSALDNRQPITNNYNHRLNMELDLQSLFVLHVHSCTLCWDNPLSPPAFVLIYVGRGAIGQTR